MGGSYCLDNTRQNKSMHREERVLPQPEGCTEEIFGSENTLKALGYRRRKLVHSSKDYKFQIQLLARSLGYPTQEGQNTVQNRELLEKEVMYTQECLYYIISEACFLDIRGRADDWTRVHLQAGDTMIVPAGSYHSATRRRFELCVGKEIGDILKLENSI
ncbi:hypothetical protein BDP27DRAFT_1361165 [Rhodocollybia butyracea]|uniref:Uncharacterized protein n=1 Tax=Rhodocollybia butyracea TaxID=206335 RepID=A0A9P5PTY9_9AGAR|nr:hypothetical protein BDP27DRAFT_1361165 [Rhodocollybia butyracea]